MQIEASDEDPSSSIFKMDGFISNSNYVAKKITMVLFINGTRLYPLCTGIDKLMIVIYHGLSFVVKLMFCNLNATFMGYATHSSISLSAFVVVCPRIRPL